MTLAATTYHYYHHHDHNMNSNKQYFNYQLQTFFQPALSGLLPHTTTLVAARYHISSISFYLPFQLFPNDVLLPSHSPMDKRPSGTL